MPGIRQQLTDKAFHTTARRDIAKYALQLAGVDSSISQNQTVNNLGVEIPISHIQRPKHTVEGAIESHRERYRTYNRKNSAAGLMMSHTQRTTTCRRENSIAHLTDNTMPWI